MANRVTLASQFPTDLARVAEKSLVVVEAYLDTHGEDMDKDAIDRARDYADIGTRMIGTGVRFMAVLNNRDAIDLQRRRLSATT